MSQYETAITDFNQIIELDPNYADAYWSRGQVHRKLGHAKEALADFRHYLELRPNSENQTKIEQWIAEIEAELEKQK